MGLAAKTLCSNNKRQYRESCISSIQFWDITTNSIVHEISFDTHINSIHFSPNGKLFVVISAYHGSVYDSVSIWGITNPELMTSPQ
jgi:WD40 repeat protein